MDPDEARTLMGWCDQRAYLFDSTLGENIRLARPSASEDEVTAALEAAGAGAWLASLPSGLATPVGEHGLAVSGGERQRIALARALLADRPILLADEPAAHLDGPTADQMTATIMRPAAGRTVVLVSHRPCDVDLADDVYDLIDGRLSLRD
jgi:ATP-binding cassette, subfamily C, bacterial CydC